MGELAIYPIFLSRATYTVITRVEGLMRIGKTFKGSEYSLTLANNIKSNQVSPPLYPPTPLS